MNKEAFISLVQDTYGVTGEALFSRDPETLVFRHRGNQKWFAIMMKISRKSLHLTGEGTVLAVNLKCDPLLIGSLRQENGFFPAWHMNKDHWITAALDGTAADDTLRFLVEMSYTLTAPKKRRRPAPTKQEDF